MSDSKTIERIAREALPHWGLEAARLELVKVSENSTFRVVTVEGETLVLRVHRDGYHSLDELRAESAWTEALNAAGISAPVARGSLAGPTHLEVADPESGARRHVGVAEWVDGQTMTEVLGDDAATEELVRRFGQLGRLAAAIHDQAAAWEPPEGYVRQHLDADGLLGDAPWWGPFWNVPQLSTAQAERIAGMRKTLYASLLAWREEARTEPVAYSMIHADLHPGNVLAAGDHLHVIDFDDASFGFHAYELAVALSHSGDHPEAAAFQQALFDGYRSVRPPAPSLFERVETFKLVRTLASMGWLHARPELGLEHEMAGLIETALARADALGL